MVNPAPQEISDNGLAIPYRLKSVADIEKALRQNLLGLSDEYKKALKIVPELALEYPAAFIRAKEVKRSFYIVREEKTVQPDVVYLCVKGLKAVDTFSEIEKRLPGLREIAKRESPSNYIAVFMKKADKQKGKSSKDKGTFERLIAEKKFIQQELLTYASANRTIAIEEKELRQIIIAHALFDSGNQDVLEAIRVAGGRRDSQDVTYQNACAELLFERIPSAVEKFIFADPNPIKKKLIAKLEKLGIEPRTRAAIIGYFPSSLPKNQLINILDKIAGISQKLNIQNEKKVKLRDYIVSLKYIIFEAEKMYEKLFLTNDLIRMKKLYVPQRIMKARISYKDVILKKYTMTRVMTLYPTKDYMDLFKGRISDDCTKINQDLSEAQLRIPNFFNIRIFNRSRWAGNIYMVDLTKKYGDILIDRIQIPRETNAFFIGFFDVLKEALADMLKKVKYNRILIPAAVSNHLKVQEIFNSYKNGLKSVGCNITEPYAKYFESLSKCQHFYVLIDNSDMG